MSLQLLNKNNKFETETVSQYLQKIKTNYTTEQYAALMAALTELYYIPSRTLQLAEWHVYGSSRVGIYKANKPLAKTINETIVAIQYQTRIKYRYNGKKQYELTNHLGNVLVTISDRRKAICNNQDSTLSYSAVVVTATDYYAFGSPMVGRTYEGDTANKYRFGMNTQEKDDEIYGKGNATTAEFWEYDTRLGRRWNVDPVIKVWESTYACLSDNPIWFNDPKGDDVKYNSLGDRLRVFIGRIVNKDFRMNFKTLKQSENLYIFKKEEFSKSGNKGEFNYKDHKGKDELIIGYSLTRSKENFKGQTRWAAMYHESKHAIQFEKGRIGFVKIDGVWNPDPLTYDQTDEVEAWDAQLLFGNIDEYKDRQSGKIDNTVSFYYKELHKKCTTTYNGKVFNNKFEFINYVTGGGYNKLISKSNSAVNCHIKSRIKNNMEFAMPYKP